MLFAASAESSAQKIFWEFWNMATKKKAAGKAKGDSMIISKSRTKAAANKCNVGSEFYGALEAHVREVIAQAQNRATANGRKTLRPQDV